MKNKRTKFLGDQWPKFTKRSLDNVKRCLRSGRWAISGPYNGRETEESRFAKKFADYNGTEYCIPTANGSSALLISLEALDIGPGDEVIVPNLTWVATASVVLRANATPVLVDIDSTNYCISVTAIKRAITKRTRAIIAVHLHCAVVDLHALIAVSKQYNIPIIEDCAQAHGAIWEGRRVGSIGRLGAFSFQQSKVLTSGEGGAVITNDSVLNRRLQELRADARRWSAKPRISDGMQLIARNGVLGANYCMSEIAACLLNAQLPMLDRQLEKQRMAALILKEIVERTGHASLVSQPTGVEFATIYELVIRLNRPIGQAQLLKLTTKLRLNSSVYCYRPDVPLNRSPLFRTDSKKRFSNIAVPSIANSFPVAEDCHSRCILLHHSVLLRTKREVKELGNELARCIAEAMA